MNNIYSTVWNKKLGRLVVASEHARRTGGGAGGSVAVSLAVVLLAGAAVLFPFHESAALTLGQNASASLNNTALGDSAISNGTGFAISVGGGRRTDGLGLSVLPTQTAYGVAVGNWARNLTAQGTALGSYATTSGIASTAIGVHATTQGRMSVALGTGAVTVGSNSMAIGSFAATNAVRANAIGNIATAGGVDSNAIGSSANASGVRSIAFGSARTVSTINGDEAVQNTTDNTRASGQDSIAIGTSAVASVQDAMALGSNSQATGAGAVALGAGATASTANSVALGAGSTTTSNPAAAAFNPGSGTLSGAASAANGEVSVGAAGSERRVTNVAAGAAATDAVNVSQLRSEAEKTNRTGAALASALGGDASYDASTGAITAPSYSVGGGTVSSVGDAIGNLDGRSTQNSLNITGLQSSVTQSTRYFKAQGANDGTDDSIATASGAIAVGRDARATNIFGTAIGSGASVESVMGVAIGTNASSTNEVAGRAGGIAIGGGARASNSGANNSAGIALGHSALADSGSLALGNAANATLLNGVALGALSSVKSQNAVALGAESVADRASTVSVGNADTKRQIVNVGAGTADHDAVNVSQLRSQTTRGDAAAAGLATALGGGASYDTATGTFTAPSYSVGGGPVANVGAAVENLDGRVSATEGSLADLSDQLNSGEIGLVRQDVETGAITVAADKAGSSVDFSGTDGARTLTGVAAGELAADSTDAVNGSQLFATNERVSTAEASIEGLDDRLGTAEGDITTLNTNVSNLDGRVSTVEGDVTTINTDIGEIRTDITSLDGRVTNVEGLVTNLTEQINSGETGLVRQNGETGAITVAADKAGSTVDFAGIDGARTLTGVAAGELAEDSTDAVTGAQLFATNERVGAAETNIEGLDERVTTTEGNVGDLTDRMDTAEGDITTINADLGEIRTDITGLDGRVTTVEGDLADLNDQLNSGETGLVRQDADTGAITVAADKGGKTVDFTGTDGARTLTGVAAGELAENSTDAVNGAQLFATNERVSTAETNIEGLDERVTTTEGNVSDLTDRMDTAEGDITTINADIGEIRTDITGLDGRVTTVEGGLADLNDQLNSGEAGLVRWVEEDGAITVAADKAGSSVDFTGTDGARTLTGVAAGELAENSTDAVNGAQLFATNERVSTAETNIEGLDERVTTTEGNVSDLTERVDTAESSIDSIQDDVTTINTNVAELDDRMTTTEGNVGDLTDRMDTAEGDITTINADIGEIRTDITGLDGRVTTVEGGLADLNDQLNSGETGLVRWVEEDGAVTVAADKGGNTVDFTGTDGARTLTGVAAGELAEDSTDAVTGAQLFATNERVSTNETNIEGLDKRVTTTEGNVSDLTDRMDTAEGDITTINTDLGEIRTDITGLDGRVTTVEGDLADLNDQLNSGETGLVRQDADTGAITVAADKAGSSVDFSGTDGARTLTGVAAGELAENSTDAVNGAQLFATNERVSTAETNIEGLDGRVTTVEGSVGDLKDALESGETGLVRQNAETGVISVAADKGGTSVSFANVDGQARVLSGVAEGVEETDAVNVRQLRSSGLIDEDGKTRDAVTYDSDSERRSVTFNGTGAPVLLQNVAAGRANTDAANVGQVRDAVALMGGGAHVDANGNVVAPNYVVDEVSYSNVGDALKGLADQVGTTKDRVTVVEQVTSNLSNAHVATSGDQESKAVAQGSNAVALGAAANASGAGSTATGWGAQATGQNSVSSGSNSQALGDNSVAIGTGARAVADNSVAIGAGSTTTRENTVSVGSVGNERAIANVADGVTETDAVNVRQLDSSMNSALNYTNQQLNQLQNEIQSVKRDANANAAAAMAVANLPQSVIPGKGMASAAVSNMGGESAVAVGVSKFSEDGRWVSKLSGTVNTRGNAGVAAGIGFHW